MSTFLGLIEEIPGISVDRFDGENIASSAYFLSHCHKDHMAGLNDAFFKVLRESDRVLYCSPISKAFLESIYNLSNSDCIKEIEIDNPLVIEYKLHDHEIVIISVTCIPAGHCPGSIMFLFERNELAILYTGDFRINPQDLPKLKSLHYRVGSELFPRKFKRIYLDTTFLCHFPKLPTRQESVLKIRDAANAWLNANPKNVVVLERSALYGSEFLFAELSELLKIKIHVDYKTYESYCRITELKKHVTNDPHSTTIHACMSKMSRSSLTCRPNVMRSNIMTIVPSVWKWEGKDVSKVGEWDQLREQTFNVCYSTHCSLEELKAFICYFDALEIYPCAYGKEYEGQVYSLLHEIKNTQKEPIAEKNQRYKLTLPNQRVLNKPCFKSEYFSDDDDTL